MSKFQIFPARRLRILAVTSAIASTLLCLALSPMPASAQKPSAQPPQLEPLPEIPPPPAGVNGSPNGNSGDSATKGDASEPTVVIRQEGDTKIEEFSINGRHYATRVTPKIGKPYVLVDPDGKGHMSPVDDAPARLRPPQWTLFTF